ncbi:MAG TPA: Ig-like domain-containing protein [Longimicrobium sp.]|nr:Ig-like domain-containing protein [Longimicrobium sp.]
MQFPRIFLPATATRLLAAAVLLASAACDDPSGPGAGPPAQLAVVSGDDQRGPVGQDLPQPLVVRVTDARGRPVEGQMVSFRVVSGGGAVYAGSSLTNRDGLAQERWTLGTVAADSQRVEARAVDAATGQPLLFGVFRAAAEPRAAAGAAAVAPAAASGLAGFALDSVGVRVVDSYGNPVAGVAVAWTVRAGGGSVSPAAATTSAQGIARAAWTLGAAGPQQLEAAAPGMPPVAFAATSVPVPIHVISGTDQTARVGLSLPQPLVVKIVTPDGQPLAGIPVRWATPDGGAVNPAQSVTDAQGMASTTWTLGTRATNYTQGSERQVVEVTVGATTVRAFFASARPGPIAAVVLDADSPVPFGDVRTARGVDALGNTVGVDEFGHTLGTGTVAWTSSAPSIVSTAAEQGARALLRGTGVGSAQITGTFGGSTASATLQVSALPRFASLTGAAANGCGMSAAGTVYCWGYAGLLGQPDTRFPECANTFRCSTTAVVVPGTPAFTQLEAGGTYACGLTGAGAVYCWNRDTRTPTRLEGGVALDSISVAGEYGCGLDAAGRAWCWGLESRGQLGNGDAGSSAAPVAVAGGLTFRTLSTGAEHACGITTDGAAYCWGWDAYGQLGSGAPRGNTCLSYRAENSRLAYCSEVPVPVAGGHTFAAISAGGHGTCALTDAGAVYCWGIVDPFTGPKESDTPHAVWSGFTLESIAGDRGAGCGLAAGGAAYCWGTNANGDLGNGTTGGGSATPVPVSGGLQFKQLSGARTHCGLTVDGSVYCWGTNDLGELGNGTRTHSPVPVRIRGQQ